MHDLSEINKERLAVKERIEEIKREANRKKSNTQLEVRKSWLAKILKGRKDR